MNLHGNTTPKTHVAFSISGRFKILLARAVASPRVRLWLLRFPMTRWLARLESQKLFDVCAGFVYSQILFAFVDANLLNALAKGPASSEELASAADLPLDRMERLLQAACAIGLASALDKRMYSLGLRGAALIENPGVIEMIKHHALLYQDLADPIRLLRDPNLPTKTSMFWSYLEDGSDPKMTQKNTIVYSELMAASQTMISEIICASVNFTRYRRILDVGGGIGIFSRYAAESAPRATVAVFDLPEVIKVIENDHYATEKFTPFELIGGDFFQDKIPSGYDMITLVRVLYDHSDENVVRLLTNIRKSLESGGTLLIAEPFASADATDRTADAYFNMYLLAMRAGNVRSFDRHVELLKSAGFSAIKKVRSVNPSLVRIILARA